MVSRGDVCDGVGVVPAIYPIYQYACPGGDEWTVMFPVTGWDGTDSVGVGVTVTFTGVLVVVSGLLSVPLWTLSLGEGW